MKSDEKIIGVFDSGVGGLSILTQIRERLPNERLCYVADSAFMPYGCKSNQLVKERCMSIAAFFAEQDCKAIVVACNTATAVAVHHLRSVYDMPVIGMEPAIKPAVLGSQSGIVGVLATSGTVASDKFKRLKQRHSLGARLIVQPCPGLVEQIEKGDLGAALTRTLLQQYLKPLMQQGIDTLVLGCTHYPFVSMLIREIVGDDILIVDTGDAIALELKRQLMLKESLALSCQEMPSIDFWSSGDVQQVEPLMTRLWGKDTVPKQFLF